MVGRPRSTEFGRVLYSDDALGIGYLHQASPEQRRLARSRRTGNTERLLLAYRQLEERFPVLGVIQLDQALIGTSASCRAGIGFIKQRIEVRIIDPHHAFARLADGERDDVR